MEIGSEFWWDGKVQYSNTKESIYNKINKNGAVFTQTGRGAIDYLIQQLTDYKYGKKVLLPSYICESVILPFEKNGFDVLYYDLKKDLSPDIEDIKRKMDVDIFMHIGYFGFSTNSEISNLLSQLNLDTLVLEDVTHTLFSKKNHNSHYAIGSIRKWLGIPSGGFLSGGKKTKDNLRDYNERFVGLRKEALLEKNKYINNSDKHDKTFLKKFNDAEEIIDEKILPSSIDNNSLTLLKNYDFNRLVSQRKKNYNYLQNRIEDNEKLSKIFELRDNDVCPMFFPIYVKDRAKLRNYLTQKEIYCPIHWPKPPQVGDKISKETQYIYDHILSIPCDQRYSQTDMDKIINCINEWSSG